MIVYAQDGFSPGSDEAFRTWYSGASWKWQGPRIFGKMKHHLGWQQFGTILMFWEERQVRWQHLNWTVFAKASHLTKCHHLFLYTFFCPTTWVSDSILKIRSAKPRFRQIQLFVFGQQDVFTLRLSHFLPPHRKLRCPLKNSGWKTTFPLKCFFGRGHLSFQGEIHQYMWTTHGRGPIWSFRLFQLSF